MFKTVAIAFSTALVAAASPALADVARTAETTTAQAGAPLVESSKAKPAAGTQRYCVSDTFIGSRIARKKCQTRDQWMKQGFDPLATK